MKFFKWIYEKKTGKLAPYYYNYSIIKIIIKPVRKFVVQVIAPNCPINKLRVWIYKLCGFKIGKNCFIGMKCYLDDMCYDLLSIGDNCTISYGVYFACHGKNQKHLPIIIQNGVYIGMRATIVSKTKDGDGLIIGNKAVIGACTLVNQNIPEGMTAVGVPCRVLKVKAKLRGGGDKL